jgi:hypothetical protein
VASPLDFDISWIYNQGMSTKKTKKGRRGRPPLGSGLAKSESILLRLAADEKEGFAEAAQLAGTPLTVWIRERLRLAARAELERAGKDVPFLS